MLQVSGRVRGPAVRVPRVAAGGRHAAAVYLPDNLRRDQHCSHGADARRDLLAPRARQPRAEARARARGEGAEGADEEHSRQDAHPAQTQV